MLRRIAKSSPSLFTIHVQRIVLLSQITIFSLFLCNFGYLGLVYTSRKVSNKKYTQHPLNKYSKSKLNSVIILLCVYILSSATTQAQPSSFPISEDVYISNYTRYGTDNGLCSNTVDVVYKGASGMMWIGTDDGLNSFDGYKIRKYLPNTNDSHSIRGKQIFEIVQTAPQRLTIALGDGGIDIYDRRTNRFEKLQTPDTENYYESAYGICTLAGNAYIIYPDCVVKRDMTTGMSERIDMPKKQPGKGVRWGRIKTEVLPGQEGYIAMATGTQSISLLDTRTNKISETKVYGFSISDICSYDADHILLATTNGIYIHDVRTGLMEKKEMLDGLNINSITPCKSENEFWVSYDGNKLIRWNHNTNKIVNIANATEMMSEQTRVNDMIEDENGLLWLATSNNGLLKLDTKKTKIGLCKINSAVGNRLTAHDISATSPDNIWFACGVNGLAHANITESEIKIYPVSHQNVVSVYARKNGDVFIGTTKTLLKLNSQSGRITEYSFKDSLAVANGRVFVNHISEDCLGNLWLSTQIGVYKFNGVKFEYVPMPDNQQDEVNCTLEDKDGRIWAGSRLGAYVLDVDGNEFRKILSRNTGRNEQGIICITEIKNNILMGSTNGVIAFDKTTGRLSKTSLCNEFADSKIFDMVTDRNGVVWLNTSTSIGYVDTNYNSVYLFDNKDGLTYYGNECHKFSMVDNTIYFGQLNAINTIKTNDISFNTKMPKTFVSEITYGQSGAETYVPMINDSVFECRYLLNASTKVSIAASDFTAVDRNKFMYKLGDGEWRNLNNTNEIMISGILPGLYTLSLRSTNADNAWSYFVKTIYINIKSPMWASRPAMIFYLIVIMALIWLILSMRFRDINRRMKQAEEEARSKRIVEAQRNRLAIVNRAQTDSINYAKRIQDSLIPKEDQVEQYFSRLFVLFRPKDIVSGDFYCLYHRDDKTFVISADCTGHGVPGAFISILGIDHLFNIIMQQKEDDAGEILTKLQMELHNAIFKNESEEFNDGMDITLCVVHHKKKVINFAGAMNDMFLIRNNEVLTYNGDRRSIGTNLSWAGMSNENKINSQYINCESGDMIYLCSDGYMDQFGGPEKRKFKIRRFKNLLLNIHKLPAKDQKLILNQKLEEWRGTIEQTDDVSVIGFEPWA